MTTDIATVQAAPAELLEKALVGGDLSRLTTGERLEYYRRLCESLGLNPLSRPFDYLQLSGKLTLYARKDATEQLRRLHGVSVLIVARESVQGVYVVTARATLPDGRADESIGAVSIDGLKGDALANAFMKSETKAKRRVTLSICGLGMLDETEIETIPDARVVPAEPAAGAANSPTAAELAKQAVSHGLITKEWLKEWCHDRRVEKVQEASEEDQTALAHRLADLLET